MKDISTGRDDDKNGDVEIEDSTGYLKFISVGSREADLIKIIEAIGENKPVLLEGPMGSGKTKLVEEVAKMAARCRIFLNCFFLVIDTRVK
jgi:MoxR-like ATPase